MHKACPESICPFWISRKPFVWPWCNSAASQRRPYWAPVISHSPMGVVSWQWDAVWLTLCTVWLSHSQISSPFTDDFSYGKSHKSQGAKSGLTDLGECDCHTVQKVSQRRLTADWLAPWESDCSRMHSKVSSDWLPSYIKATRPVLRYSKWTDTFWTALVSTPAKCKKSYTI